MPSATRDLPSLWQNFLSEVDRRLPEPVEVHCLGGFVVTLLYGLTRTTNDVDYIEIRPAGAGKVLQAIAGPTSGLSRAWSAFSARHGGQRTRGLCRTPRRTVSRPVWQSPL